MQVDLKNTFSAGLGTILSVRNLQAWFDTFQALKGISLEYSEKTVSAIIGPSGCGKSTYIRCLNRIHEEVPGASVQGDVFLKNENIYEKGKDPVEIRRKIGMVFQKPNPFPNMSIFENTIIGLKLQGQHTRSELQDIAENCLRKAALWDEVKDKLGQDGSGLSGGQQQRLCIARPSGQSPSFADG